MSNLYNWTNGMPLGIFVDLPVVADVRSGVKFDAFEGTLVLPTEAQVLRGVGFGAAAAEFEGTLLFNADIAVAIVAPDDIEVEVD